MTENAAPPTEDQMRCLAALADAIIPPSEIYGVPGAGDPAIVAAILEDAGRRRGRVLQGLADLDALAEAEHGARFADLSTADRDVAAAAFRAGHSGIADRIASLAAQCYYRDDRVMRSLGMEPRPPHPEGYKVPDGDWSLLDPVRRRDPLYRKAE